MGEREIIRKRMLARKKMRQFYLSVHATVKAFGCPAKAMGIEFEPKEQKEAERIWAEMDVAFNSLQNLIFLWQARDNGLLKGEEDGES